MKICNKCSVANDDKAVFCVGCGAVLPRADVVTEPVAESAPVSAAPTEPVAEVQNGAPLTPPTPEFVPPVQSAPPVQPVPPVSPMVQPVSPPRPAFQQPPVQPPYGYAINPAALPIEYQPVTLGEYILYAIGFGIPVLGLVLMLVTAFGNGKKISLKNYAKATLIVYAIGAVLGVIMAVAVAAFSIMLYDY